MSVYYDSKEYPLTHKWLGLVRKVFKDRANQGDSVPFDELLQESLLVEWKLPSSMGDSYKDLAHRENYFKKAMMTRLLHYGHDSYNRRKADLFTITPAFEEKDVDISKILDEHNDLCASREFNDIFYEDLKKHIVCILKELDQQSAEMFRLRVVAGLRWNIIRQKHFSSEAHNKYYNRVKLIKNIVSRCCNYKLEERKHFQLVMA